MRSGLRCGLCGWIPRLEIGRSAGLRHVYAGNHPGAVGDREDTRCAACGTTLIPRTGFTVGDVRVTKDGTCPDCGEPIPGRW